MGANLFSASEIGLARSRTQSPHLLKTLFLLEHLPDPASAGSHVLGLVFNVFGVYLAARTPRGGRAALPTRYPIYFVVKHRCFSLFCGKKPSPEALETCRNQPRKAGRPVSGSAPDIELAASRNQ